MHRDVVLLEGESEAQVSCRLEQIFFLHCPVFGSIHFALKAGLFSSPCWWKAFPQFDATTTMLLCQGDEPNVALCARAKMINFGLIRPDNLFPTGFWASSMQFGKLQMGFNKAHHSSLKLSFVEGLCLLKQTQGCFVDSFYFWIMNLMVFHSMLTVQDVFITKWLIYVLIPGIVLIATWFSCDI